VGTCELCKRTLDTTRHHLVPHERRRKEKKNINENGVTADLCNCCHRKIHATFDNKTLARQYPTIEKLRGAPELQKYIRWIWNKPPSTYFGSSDARK